MTGRPASNSRAPSNSAAKKVAANNLQARKAKVASVVVVGNGKVIHSKIKRKTNRRPATIRVPSLPTATIRQINNKAISG
jgi:hypothetical protein